MIKFLLLVSRQGRVRLAKWYVTMTTKEKTKIIRDMSQVALARTVRMTNVIEVNGQKIICRRYASLYFIAGIEQNDNELALIEVIHHFVEVLDKYFGNVCELDLIFNFHRSFLILDEVMLGGELVESSKRSILKYIHTHDTVADESEEALGGNFASQVMQALKSL